MSVLTFDEIMVENITNSIRTLRDFVMYLIWLTENVSKDYFGFERIVQREYKCIGFGVRPK